jgi:hypothetical protein
MIIVIVIIIIITMIIVIVIVIIIIIVIAIIISLVVGNIRFWLCKMKVAPLLLTQPQEKAHLSTEWMV